MSERISVGPGAEISVGAPAEALADDVERLLRDVVQALPAVAFASTPAIAFPGQGVETVLVVFLRGGSDVDATLTAVSEQVAAAMAALAEADRKRALPSLAVLPIPLDRPLDGLAQAVVMTRTEIYVADAGALLRARRGPQPWWRRIFGG